jgi:hypothetical protein
MPALAAAALPPAEAPAALGLGHLELGASAEEVEAALGKLASWQVARSAAADPQSLSRALLQSGLLAMLRQAGVDSPSDRELGQLRFVVASRSDARYLLLLRDDKLALLFGRLHVEPDRSVGGRSNPFAASRLAPIAAMEAELARSCRLEAIPYDGANHRDSRGSCGAARLHLSYRPAIDEFWLLLRS